MPRHQGQRRPPAQKKPSLTHFLCLPLVTPSSRQQLEASLATFRADLKPEAESTSELIHQGSGDESSEPAPSQEDRQQTSSGLPFVHPKAIRPVGALHLTLGVMSLKSDELKAALDLLETLNIAALLSGTSQTSEAEISATDPPAAPLTLALTGLQSMHDAHKTSILYSAPTETSERLYNFCLALQKAFREKGFLAPDDRELKLHATIVNTIYAKPRKRSAKRPKWVADPSSIGQPGSSDITESASNDQPEGHGPNANAPFKMDATRLLERYKDFIWADNVVLDRVVICEMGTKKVLDEHGNVSAEEYTEVASVPLPA